MPSTTFNAVYADPSYTHCSDMQTVECEERRREKQGNV
jgi:hypothetical protein